MGASPGPGPQPLDEDAFLGRIEALARSYEAAHGPEGVAAEIRAELSAAKKAAHARWKALQPIRPKAPPVRRRRRVRTADGRRMNASANLLSVWEKLGAKVVAGVDVAPGTADHFVLGKAGVECEFTPAELDRVRACLAEYREVRAMLRAKWAAASQGRNPAPDAG